MIPDRNRNTYSHSSGPITAGRGAAPLRIAITVCALLGTLTVLDAAPPAHAQQARQRIEFLVSVSKDLAPKGASGRLLVFMSDATTPRDELSTGFVPGSTWVAAAEVEHLSPDQPIRFDPDTLAYPKPFSEAKPGKWQVMALLDPDHTFAYHGSDGGDLLSKVEAVADLNPADHAPIPLTLTRQLPERPEPQSTDSVKRIDFESPALTRFWGRPITMKAGVVLPPDYADGGTPKYPTVYHLHGFGGDRSEAWFVGARLRQQMTEGKRAKMVHVYLDGSCPTGHHEFADSVNNGPWGTALTTELIPYLEKEFRLAPAAAGRFVTGHSSGGWSSLWLQVTYPEVFGDTWSTAPDPVDFRSFTGVDASPTPAPDRANAYRKGDGTPLNLVRAGGREIATLEQFARQERVTGDYGGQFASFEWVFSPKGPGGRPMPLFNRETGETDPAVRQAWRKYDIRETLESRWPELGPKLKGKLHVICGGEDTFHLEEAVRMLAEALKRLGSDAVVEIIPGRNHGDLYQPNPAYPDGLAARIDKEMWSAWEARKP